jgi:hypothetical protein
MTLFIKAGAVVAAAWLASVAPSHAQVPRPDGGLDSFAAKGSAAKICGNDAFIAVVGCGRAGNGADVRSETALIVAISGSADIYTVQWAERGAATAKVDVEAARWQDRLRRLAPMKLCAIVVGEKAPYPSCIGKSQGRFETGTCAKFRLPAAAPFR